MASESSANLVDTNWSGKTRCNLSRGLKRLLTTLSHVRSIPKSHPNILSQFDIITFTSAKSFNSLNCSSQLSISDGARPRSDTTDTTATSPSPGASSHRPRRKIRKKRLMADRILAIKLESVYEGEEPHESPYVFTSALQDARHSQGIKSISVGSVMLIDILSLTNPNVYGIAAPTS